MNNKLELLELRKQFSQNNSFSSHDKLSKFSQNNPAFFSKCNVAFLSNFTFDTLIPLINGEMANQGLSSNSFLPDFDSIPNTVLDPNSGLYKFEPNYILITHWLDTLSSILTKSFTSSSSESVETELDRLSVYFKSLFSSIRKKSNAIILINNFPLPEKTTLGILDIQADHSNIQAILKLNDILHSTAREFNSVYIVDYFSLFARIGYDNSYDSKYWHMARYPFGRKAMLPIANEYGKFFRALTGKSKKCLVLDCDNTLWGGVIGEDGLAGIKIGDSHPGQSFRDFQHEIVNLYHRGIILALCSKNNESDVFEVFENHTDMVLKKEHLTTWQINWDDKATNLKRIASDLNIGVDSLVFIDDNPFECNLIKEQLPEVSVIQVEKNTTLLSKQLLQGGLFDTLTFSNEDKNRNKMYRSEKTRKQLQESSNSLEDYLKSLKLKVFIEHSGIEQVSRIAQLTQKTNQFNLTTQRYSEEDINSFRESKNCDVYYMKLEDKVSDLGIIGVAIIKKCNNIADIDTLLMSCRALGRGAERAFISKIVKEIFRDATIEKITGKFIPTTKNGQVRNLLSDTNFKKIEGPNEDTIYFELEKNCDLPKPPDWIELIEL